MTSLPFHCRITNQGFTGIIVLAIVIQVPSSSPASSNSDPKTLIYTQTALLLLHTTRDIWGQSENLLNRGVLLRPQMSLNVLTRQPTIFYTGSKQCQFIGFIHGVLMLCAAIRQKSDIDAELEIFRVKISCFFLNHDLAKVYNGPCE